MLWWTGWVAGARWWGRRRSRRCSSGRGDRAHPCTSRTGDAAIDTPPVCRDRSSRGCRSRGQAARTADSVAGRVESPSPRVSTRRRWRRERRRWWRLERLRVALVSRRWHSRMLRPESCDQALEERWRPRREVPSAGPARPGHSLIERIDANPRAADWITAALPKTGARVLLVVHAPKEPALLTDRGCWFHTVAPCHFCACFC